MQTSALCSLLSYDYLCSMFTCVFCFLLPYVFLCLMFTIIIKRYTTKSIPFYQIFFIWQCIFSLLLFVTYCTGYRVHTRLIPGTPFVYGCRGGPGNADTCFFPGAGASRQNSDTQKVYRFQHASIINVISALIIKKIPHTHIISAIITSHSILYCSTVLLC